MSILADDNPHLFIHVSTSEVYGTADSDVMDENHPLNPMSPYAAAKTGADRLVYAFHQTYELPVITVRPFNNFGPYQHLEKVIPRFITSALTNSPIRLHGDGSARRDFLHVDDTCAALESILSSDVNSMRGETFNIASGKDRSISEVAAEILTYVDGSESPLLLIEDRPGQVFRHTGDASKLTAATGWKPQWEFSDALRGTIEWYRHHEDWWRPLWSSREIAIRNRAGDVVYH
jgi:dTDP-glucose 4,6-dehydratase